MSRNMKNLNWTGCETLEEDDPEIFHLIQKEKERQTKGLELIAAENFCSRSSLEALGSCLSNKLSSGYPGSRGYGGTEIVDQIELLCQQRALKAFRLNGRDWGVNVQPYSGSVANTAVYTAVLKAKDKIMGLALHDGGHFSHGFKREDGRGSAAATYFEAIPYRINPNTGYVDYENLSELSKEHKPKLIIAGTSTHSRLMDYKKFREICDAVGAILMADMAHVAGLVAGGVIPSPFEYADIVTTTTHKTLRGVEGALIFYRKGERLCPQSGKITAYDFEENINLAVFPGHQGGPHCSSIAGIAVALRQATEPHFFQYQEQVLKNSRAISEKLKDLGYSLLSGGTDNHLMVVDLRNKNAHETTVQLICNEVKLVLTYVPNGIRIGTPPLTSRGLKEKDFEIIAGFIDQGVAIAEEVTKLFKVDKNFIFDEARFQKMEVGMKTKMLRQQIEKFASKFPIPGFSDH